MSNDESMYRAPESSLDRPVEGTARSIDDAVEGRWDFDIGDVLREAWRLVDGSKLDIWKGIGVIILAQVIYQVLNAFAVQSESGVLLLLSFLLSLAASFVNYIMQGGIFKFSIKRAAGDASASFDDVMSAFSMALPIIGVMLLYTILAGIGFLLLILPGIYLVVALWMALPLKVERDLGIWESITTSRQAVHHHWFKVAGLMLITGLGVGLGSLLTLGIGAIWLVPFGSLITAVAYREIFGYSGT